MSKSDLRSYKRPRKWKKSLNSLICKGSSSLKRISCNKFKISSLTSNSRFPKRTKKLRVTLSTTCRLRRKKPKRPSKTPLREFGFRNSNNYSLSNVPRNSLKGKLSRKQKP